MSRYEALARRLVEAAVHLQAARKEYEQVKQQERALNQRQDGDRMRNPQSSPGLKRVVGGERFVLETREVQAAAYLGPNKGRTMLSHSCWIDRRGLVREVLCGRVSELSIADRFAQDTALEPTCTTCIRRKKKLQP